MTRYNLVLVYSESGGILTIGAKMGPHEHGKFVLYDEIPDVRHMQEYIEELEQEIEYLNTAHRCALEERNRLQDQLQREKDRRVGVVQRNKDINNVNQALEKQLNRSRPHCICTNQSESWCRVRSLESQSLGR